MKCHSKNLRIKSCLKMPQKLHIYCLYAFGNSVFFWKPNVCWSRIGKVTYVKRIGLLKLSQRYAYIKEKLY